MYNRFWWAVAVPIDVATNANLSPYARQLYMTMLSLTAKGFHNCRLTLRQLAETSGIKSRRSLGQVVQELTNHGWVAVEKLPGPEPTQYTLLKAAAPAARAAQAASAVQAAPAAQAAQAASAVQAAPAAQAAQAAQAVQAAPAAQAAQAAQAAPAAHTVPVPGALIRHGTLPPAAKCMYVLLRARNANNRGVTMQLSELARNAGIRSPTTVISHIKKLVGAGWLRVTPGGQRPNRYEPLDPHLAAREEMLGRVQARMRREPFKGEAILKELLNVLVADDRFQDNARPGFLINPLTGERLEFDRWYTEAGVAFEFNGPQHEQPTAFSPDMAAVRAQQARDLMKAAIAAQHDIALIVVQPGDLRFERLAQLIGNRLPLRKLQAADPVIKYLTRDSRAYARQWA